MSKWDSTYLDSGSLLPKDELGHCWHLPTTKVFSIPLMILKQKLIILQIFDSGFIVGWVVICLLSI